MTKGVGRPKARPASEIQFNQYWKCVMEPSQALHELSEPWSSGERVKCAIARAANLAGLSYWRAFDIWYRKARRIEDYETAQISEALERKNRLDTRNELSELRLRLARLESLLVQTDPDFHRPTVDFVRQSVRGSR